MMDEVMQDLFIFLYKNVKLYHQQAVKHLHSKCSTKSCGSKHTCK